MSDHLFVYFRVPEAVAAEALPLWHRWMETVAEATGIGGTLMRRPETRAGVQTWMESYADIPPAFDVTLAGLWRQSGLDQWVDGERQAEHFIDLDVL
ncbi:DUF4936 family protein [Cupriavidus consociatus]|uniref:DUF4936 family protein n=1 Tax=Cupriavidus consociatus TaxID=2821357 RepID=UPI001AE5D37F|nr:MULTISPECIES: DUF4936 family protein [unclassified Cupriavidus]MBP0622710.1 DUF4936 family protein [Cupriavidus sp. LEh25]MDK2659395.1 DUF4936 family protein [Cupriavidus sp. LEh21]